MRPWSHVTDPAFLQLVDEIRAADVSITNLETVIHEFKGYAQHDCGGGYTTSPPEIAAELKWAGFDMLAHANNHTFDYGSSAVLETIEHAERAGLVLAGSGADLQQARAPRYFRCGGGIVGLGDDASPSDVFAIARKRDLKLLDERHIFEGFAAVLTVAGGRIARIRLLPIDLQFDAPEDRRGRPRIASAEMGRRIIDRVASSSRRHGTCIRYDTSANCVEVEIG